VHETLVHVDQHGSLQEGVSSVSVSDAMTRRTPLQAVLKKYSKKSFTAMEAKLDKLHGSEKSKNYHRYPEADKLWIRQQIEIIEMVKEVSDLWEGLKGSVE
jgi:hypothetical protein